MQNIENNFDVVILGSGSTAMAAATVAKQLNKTVMTTEEKDVGGVCLNAGCTPSKFLIEAAKTLFTIKNPRFRGIHGNHPKLDFKELLKQKDSIIDRYREKATENFESADASIVRGHARFVDQHTIDVDGQRFTADKFLIATGSRPRIPYIDGLLDAGYLTSDLLTHDGAEELKVLPNSIVIIGAGYIALELGQTFSRLGSKVTILERSDQLLSRGYELEVGTLLKEVFEREGIEILFKTEIRSVSRVGAHLFKLLIETDGKEKALQCERVLVAAGRQANVEAISIENAGVELAAKGFVQVDEHLRTTADNIYAAGDVIGSAHGNQMATPVGVQDAKLAIQNAFSEVGSQSVDHRLIPRTIFSDPEIASIGLTTKECRKLGYNVETRTIPLTRISRAVMMQHLDGFLRIVSDGDTREILGVTFVGPSAGEIIHTAVASMRMNAPLDDLIDMMYVYPSLSEGLKYAARSEAD